MKQIGAIGIAVAIALAAYDAEAQNMNSPEQPPKTVNFAPEIGIIQSGVQVTSGNAATSLKPGLHLGGIADISLNDNLAIQPGIFYQMKGYQLDNPGSAIETRTGNPQVRLSYFELPANVVYKFGDPDDARFMIGAGPYVSYLFGATVNTEPQDPTDIPIGGSAAGNLRRFDFGVDAFIGCQMPKGFYFKIGGESGLINIQQAGNNTYVNYNYDFQASIGYILSYNK